MSKVPSFDPSLTGDAFMSDEDPTMPKHSEVNALRELPLLGSNQDSPDPEKGESANGDPSSGVVRPFPANPANQDQTDAPLAPVQSTHSHRSTHRSPLPTEGTPSPHRFKQTRTTEPL